jgi:O-antigen ligase
VYAEKEGLLLRYHALLHGTHLFLVQGEAEGSSFFQRLIFWRVGWRLFKKHPFFGTGTGDVKKEIKAEYESYPVYVEPKYRLRAHNQFITFLMTFGMVGCAYFLFFLAFTTNKARHHPLFLFFMVVSIMSFLTEDTLETQAGVTFFSFFLSLFSALKE